MENTDRAHIIFSPGILKFVVLSRQADISHHWMLSMWQFDWATCGGRRDDGGPQSLWWDLPVSQRDGVSRVLGGAAVGHHMLRQLRAGHADGVPVHHSGGMDWHALLGEYSQHFQPCQCNPSILNVAMSILNSENNERFIHDWSLWTLKYVLHREKKHFRLNYL